MRHRFYISILIFIFTVFGLSACLPFSLLKDKPSARKTSSKNPSKTNANSGAPVTLNVGSEALYVNVKGAEMPDMPNFEELSPKAGKVCGYVKDWTGKPLENAEIGLRTSYLAGSYSGVTGKTDADGYYEIKLPEGIAQFYNAGYRIEWGDGGLAAIGLHPVDGKIESFTSYDGAVENFVMLPFGITSPENLQENPRLASTYYGGAIYLNWYSVAADDNNAPPFAVREGSKLEITLTPEGNPLDEKTGQQSFIIHKTLGMSGNFTINNIPLGRYRISVKADGKPLKMKDNKKYDPKFGMSPEETEQGEASVLFIPDSAKASSVSPQAGAWKVIEIGLSTP